MGIKYKNIYNKIYEFDNLYSAYRKARKGKRNKKEVSEFEYDLESNLFKIQQELKNGTFRFSGYNEFVVTDPKERKISAAPFKDRVVHHAICNFLEPMIDKTLMHQTYACRYNKGSHRAISKAVEYVRKYKYVLKLDVKKYFFSIDHENLLKKLRKKISDKKLLSLIKLLLETHDTGQEYYMGFEDDTLFDYARCKGLPIGNLTSQLFANFYLNQIDRLICEKLRIKSFVRYMDDIIIFTDSKLELADAFNEIEKYLGSNRLKLNRNKSMLINLKNGLSYLGFHLYKGRIKILRSNLKRFIIKMRKYSRYLKDGKIQFESILMSLNSWLGFIGKGKYVRLINGILDKIKFMHQDKNYEFTFCV
ncbi:MAG: RNA-dependent DNA polymerase [Candidatus Delongbacteria bacterium]|nr:RNA-dependent DNA polymerase [Candidatus Delongbacteria bacterium]